MFSPSNIDHEIKKLQERVNRLESSGPSFATMVLFMILLYAAFPGLFGSLGEDVRLVLKAWILK